MSNVYSMTGFATAQAQAQAKTQTDDGLGFTLTLKSVNHRFLDLSLRLPSGCDELEMALRRVLKESLRRGHIDVTLQILRGSETSSQLHLNEDLLAAHVAAFRQAAAQYGVAAEPDLNAILRHPGVLRAEAVASPESPSTLREAVLALLPDLIERLNEVRAQEGASLVAELRAAMLRLEGLTAEVTIFRADIRATYIERIRSRMEELLGASIAEDRLLAEAALLAERSDIDEELVRLQTHVARFLILLDEGGELGKRLDFLLQELNREANTLLSKTSGATGGNGLRITELGLEMKLEIEKAREQVQNLE
jgi:uncharacterized protein (TIGR00255 family)